MTEDDDPTTPLPLSPTPSDPGQVAGPPPRQRSARGATALVTGTAVLATALGGALGWQAGRPDPGPSSTATAATTQPGGGAWGGTAPPPSAGRGWQGLEENGPEDGSEDGSVDGLAADTGTGASATDAQVQGLVRITTTTLDGEAAGTGMVLSSDGTVVTNHHVVEGATTITAEVVSTGETFRAEFVGADATADVAVLRLVGASGLTPVRLDQDPVATGDDVTAVGDGEGREQLSAASGEVVVRRTSITVSDADGSPARLRQVIEIRAAVVPGYSGGATYDAEGEVLGMTTAASSGTPLTTAYAVPVAQVRRTVARIETLAAQGRSTDRVDVGRSGFLGVGVAGDGGAQVATVSSGSAAERAGLGVGDTVTSVAGSPVGTVEELRSAVSAHAPGDRVELGWLDSTGQTHRATVTLGVAPVA